MYNGYVYATAHLYSPDLYFAGWRTVDFVEILKGFEIAPGDPNDISVCAAHPWGTSYLVFSDGSACGTPSQWDSSEQYRLDLIGFAI
jgi:hypothetical protein